MLSIGFAASIATTTPTTPTIQFSTDSTISFSAAVKTPKHPQYGYGYSSGYVVNNSIDATELVLVAGYTYTLQ